MSTDHTADAPTPQPGAHPAAGTPTALAVHVDTDERGGHHVLLRRDRDRLVLPGGTAIPGQSTALSADNHAYVQSGHRPRTSLRQGTLALLTDGRNRIVPDTHGHLDWQSNTQPVLLHWTRNDSRALPALDYDQDHEAGWYRVCSLPEMEPADADLVLAALTAMGLRPRRAADGEPPAPRVPSRPEPVHEIGRWPLLRHIVTGSPVHTRCGERMDAPDKPACPVCAAHGVGLVGTSIRAVRECVLTITRSVLWLVIALVVWHVCSYVRIDLSTLRLLDFGLQADILLLGLGALLGLLVLPED